MLIQIGAHELADALANHDPEQIMVFLAALAAEDDHGDLIDAIIERHNGTAEHRAVLPWLRQVVQALEEIEAQDDSDAAGIAGNDAPGEG